MWTYIIKRILWMIPTFFFITLVVFVIIRMAPGKPSQISADPNQAQEQTAASIERERNFRAEFGLDRPSIINRWHWTETQEIYQMLHEIMNPGNMYDPKVVNDAQKKLEDMGKYAVPHLIQILASSLYMRRNFGDFLKATNQYHANEEMIALTVTALSRNSQTIKVIYDREDISEAELDELNAIREQNFEFKENEFKYNADEPTKAIVINYWLDYWKSEKTQQEYSFTARDKLNDLFLDTGFAKWWRMLLGHGSFGHSKVDRKPVMTKIWGRLKYSLILSFLSVLLSYFISIPLGILSAYKKDTLGDRATTIVLFIMYSLPSFFVGVLLLQFFSEGGTWKIFPTGGFNSPDFDQMNTIQKIGDISWHLFLPVVTLTYASLAALSRYARTGLLDVLGSDYIRTARAKGNSELIVVGKHALRNGMIPILTLLGGILPILIGGSVIVELIFDYPGIGSLYYEAIYTQDEPVIMAVTTIAAAVTMVGILLSDISYALADPRITYESKST